VPYIFRIRQAGKSKLELKEYLRYLNLLYHLYLEKVRHILSHGRVTSHINTKDWDRHWQSGLSQTGLFGWIVSAYRKTLLANEMKHYSDIYFAKSGNFIECGSGSSQSSSKINKGERKLLALDISRPALLKAKEVLVIDFHVQGDIFNLPFRSDSIDGIWNFGVMEHFKEDELIAILTEFKRVLKGDSVGLLFWPWRLGPVHLAVEITETLARVVSRKRIIFFPTEYTLFKRMIVNSLLAQVGFSSHRFHLSPYGGFVHWVVVIQK